MASFSARKPAPAWPPFKNTYKRLGDSDAIPLTFTPEIDTAATHSSTFMSKIETPHYNTVFTNPTSHWYNNGWRGGAKVAFCSVVSVLLINIILTVVISTTYERMDSMYMIYIGSCEKSERINTGIHFVVNLLSTALLAASNYCMQLLSAPTRQDIDKAHSKGSWLDIGVASVRNLRALKSKKVALWWVMALSSVPLHLFYNSVFFTAIATNEYDVFYATEGFIDGAFYNKTTFPNLNWVNVTDVQSHASTYEKLSNSDCIRKYATDFVSDRKDIIAVVKSNSSMSTSSLQKITKNVVPSGGLNQSYNAFAWICDDPSTPAKTGHENGDFCSAMVSSLEQTADTEWRSGGFEIEYCMSELMNPDCHVHFAPPIIAPVIFFNLINAVIITYVAFFYKDRPIVTLGDAIESFSLHPDPTTLGMCLATHNLIEKHWIRGYTAQPIRYDGERRRWYKSVSWKQWTSFATFFGIIAAGLIVLIAVGIGNLTPSTIANAWSLGLGTVRTQNIIPSLELSILGANGVLLTAIVANAPQLLFSFFYIIFNNVFTTMVLSDEWDQFSIKSGKGRVLRVSEPRGAQRSTYFLQIPYRYAVVMLSISGVTHWLVSQSLFLANIAVIPLDGTLPMHDEVTSCAYSVKAMILILVVGVIMLAWVIGNSFRRFSGDMPFVGSNSAAISAACHSEYGLKSEREAMVLKALRWGVTDYGGRTSARRATTANMDVSPFVLGTDGSMRSDFKSASNFSEDGFLEEALSHWQVGHCAFTDGRVGKPVTGRLYA